jgi:hypothetical protein
MDTIAKAENVAMALTIFFFSNMNKRFQSSMSLEKRSMRFYFFTVAVNKKSSQKSH